MIEVVVLGVTEPRILKLNKRSNKRSNKTNSNKRRISLATLIPNFKKVSVHHKLARQNKDNSEVDAVGQFPMG